MRTIFDNFRKTRLLTKVLLIEFIGICIPFIPKSILDYKEISHHIDESQSAFMLQLDQNLVKGLRNPLWNFAPEDAKLLIGSLMSNQIITRILVKDSKDKVFIDLSNEKAATSNLAPTEATLNLDISYSGRVIGHTTVWTDERAIKKTKNMSLMKIVLGNILALAFILSMTYLLLKKSFLSRLKKLAVYSQNLTNERLEQAFEWQHGDEIDELGMSFETARQKLKKLISTIQNKNRELLSLNINLEKEVDARSKQLAQTSKMASLGEMAGGVAHEINNPIAIIRAKAHQLRRLTKEGHPIHDQLQAGLQIIEKTTTRITKIIEGLRTFARSDVSTSTTTTHLSKIIEDVHGLCFERFKSHGVKLETAVVSDVEVECRVTQIEQVLVNLANNAYDAIMGTENPWVRIEAGGNGQTIYFTVTDSGNGIPDAVAEKLFQPFFTTKPIGKGTGLGLSISHGIAKAHSGSLRINKNSAHTQFVLEIPAYQTQQIVAA